MAGMLRQVCSCISADNSEKQCANPYKACILSFAQVMTNRGQLLGAVASTRDGLHCTSGRRRRASETITQSGINKRVRTDHRKLDLEEVLIEDPHPSLAAAPSPPDVMASSRGV
jgi:hypothetical protein